MRASFPADFCGPIRNGVVVHVELRNATTSRAPDTTTAAGGEGAAT
jgi:hypothetical protein